MFSSYPAERGFTKGFRLVLEPFLQSPGLPFAEVLSDAEVEATFVAAGVCLEKPSRTVFTPAVTLWAWLSQVVHAGELSSCAAAVMRVAVLLLALGRKPCSTDTAAYCRARAKLPEAVLRRLVVLLALATAAVCGVGMAACLGKETGETTLLREMMDPATYAAIPATLTVREIGVDVEVPGFRVTRIVRTKTPAMVQRDVWVHLLAYNLIRKAAAQAALTQEKLPRQIGFAGTRQTIAASWSDLSKAPPQTVRTMASQQFPLIAQHEVGNRPNRVEPRAVKRRPKPYRLLQQPRRQARAELLRTRRPRD